MKIKNIVEDKKVEYISANSSIHELVNSLNMLQIGALVVSEDGKRIDGIVSERDVVRAMPRHLNHFIDLHVRDIMSHVVYTCTPESTFAELMMVMTENRVRHLPVTDEDGKLISIISIGDVVKNYINELDFERVALEHYVIGGI